MDNLKIARTLFIHIKDDKEKSQWYGGRNNLKTHKDVLNHIKNDLVKHINDCKDLEKEMTSEIKKL